MSEPKSDVSLNSNQSAYPLLHLFFHLGLKLRLLQKKILNRSLVVEINGELFSQFKKKTASEQYVTLLDCFWTEVDWESLQKQNFRHIPSNVDRLFDYLIQK